MGCEHAQAAGGQTSPSQFEENTLSEVKRVIAVIQRNHRILVPKGDTVVLYTQTYMANADDLKI